MRWILSIIAALALLFIVGCTQGPGEKVAISLVGSDGEVVMRETYVTLTALDTQAIATPEGRKVRKFSNTFRNAIADEANKFQEEKKSDPSIDPPQLRIEYIVSNTGNIPISVNVDARVKGFFFSGGDNND